MAVVWSDSLTVGVGDLDFIAIFSWQQYKWYDNCTIQHDLFGPKSHQPTVINVKQTQWSKTTIHPCQQFKLASCLIVFHHACSVCRLIWDAHILAHMQTHHHKHILSILRYRYDKILIMGRNYHNISWMIQYGIALIDNAASWSWSLNWNNQNCSSFGRKLLLKLQYATSFKVFLSKNVS